MKSTLEEVTGIKMQNKPRKAVLKSTGELEVIHYNDQLVEFVNCNECNCQHLTHENSYLELVGNLHVGGEGRGGLLGNGDWKNIGVPVYYFCINNQCLSDYIRKVELKELTTQTQIPEIHERSRFYTTVPLATSPTIYITSHNVLEVVTISKDEIRIRTDVYVEGEGRKPTELGIWRGLLQTWLLQGKLEVLQDKQGKEDE
ncbi:hypothetical protein SHANETTE_197 [Bacillus phage Shanette]|uniref:Uncharacterized protein n=1 Tax=Bacillus phage Shanette TaxID=1296656 RepID=S5MBC0_9CAUD|nr:hypothetical protein AVV46_gp100 [Bacillus phage Shanette]AGR47089.1 hypothetical protein SHANETTE_197 [Bacillus phage Shanette]